MKRRTLKKRLGQLRRARRKGYLANRGWDQRWSFIARTGHDVDPHGWIVPFSCNSVRHLDAVPWREHFVHLARMAELVRIARRLAEIQAEIDRRAAVQGGGRLVTWKLAIEWAHTCVDGAAIGYILADLLPARVVVGWFRRKPRRAAPPVEVTVGRAVVELHGLIRARGRAVVDELNRQGGDP